MEVFVTGGGGFIGSHAAIYFAQQGHSVTILDNLSRHRNSSLPAEAAQWNWNRLPASIKKIEGSTTDTTLTEKLAAEADLIIHTAAQVAAIKSIEDPRTDFETNTLGTFNVLEGARKGGKKPIFIFCSTNKVYGDNVNKLPVTEGERRYSFSDKKLNAEGIPETFPIDGCGRTPYGCSKTAADLYVQDYGLRGWIRSGIFRMSTIYGLNQFGNAEQGWIANFTISTALGRIWPVFGDGKQVRDPIFVEDLLRAWQLFIDKADSLSGQVFNLGGGPKQNLSILELKELLEKISGKKVSINWGDWWPNDQKVYVSGTAKAKQFLGWEPKISLEEGIGRLYKWIEENRRLF